MRQVPIYYKSEEEMNEVQRWLDGITLASHLVDSAIRAQSEYPSSYLGDFDIDNANNYFSHICDNCGETVEDEHADNCEHCNEELTTSQEPKEVMEWYIVDSWLVNRLNDIGEVTLKACGLNFWGRTCTGQAVELDETFQRVYRYVNGAYYAWKNQR